MEIVAEPRGRRVWISHRHPWQPPMPLQIAWLHDDPGAHQALPGGLEQRRTSPLEQRPGAYDSDAACPPRRQMEVGVVSITGPKPAALPLSGYSQNPPSSVRDTSHETPASRLEVRGATRLPPLIVHL